MSWVETIACDPIREVDILDLAALTPGRHRLAVHLSRDAASRPIAVPVVVDKGAEPGLTMGITAALHGDELNGIPTIHRLLERVDPATLRGTIVAVPIANVPGYLANQRTHPTGADLNRLMPGKPHGNEAEVYAHRLVERIIREFDVLIDLHTASRGRINSLYVRADMTRAETATMARKVGAEIIVHNAGADGTLRAAATDLGIPSITVEVGDPNIFDAEMIRESRIGVRDVLEHLDMLDPDEERASSEAIECSRSRWLYTDTGGLLRVRPQLTERVAAGDLIATLTDPWGRLIRRYLAPEPGIVIGKSTHPVAATGARILHLGTLRD